MFSSLKNSFPNDTEIATDNVEGLFVHGFIFDVETFGFDACFFEVVEGVDEAFIAGGVRSERKVLFGSKGFGSGTSAGGGFKLSGYMIGWVMVVLNEGLKGDRWLTCSMEFCNGSHGGKFLKFLRVVY